MSTIEADEVDIPTTRIPKVQSVDGGAIKTVELFALCLKVCVDGVESHIIWDAPALVTASCSGTTCDLCVYWETATFNSNVTWD